MYREYLDPAYHDEFDALAGRLHEPVPGPAGRRAHPQLGRRPAHRRAGGRRRRRPRSSSRTRCRRSSRPGALVARPPDAGGVRAAPGRHPGPQPLAGRLVRRAPRAPGRHRPDLPERRRRGHRRRALGRRARPAGRDPAARRCPTTPSTSSRCTRPTTTRCGRCARSSASSSTTTRAAARPTTGATRRPACCGSPRRRSSPAARSPTCSSAACSSASPACASCSPSRARRGSRRCSRQLDGFHAPDADRAASAS